jgi:hypothetical protein
LDPTKTNVNDNQREGSYRASKPRTQAKVPALFATSTTMAEPDSSPLNSKNRIVTNFNSMELGEMILNTHRYLVLLDFSSPQPFPANQCDEIHTSLQQFYNTIGTTTDDDDDDHISVGMIQRMDPIRQVQWLHTIQQKHHELMKFL